VGLACFLMSSPATAENLKGSSASVAEFIIGSDPVGHPLRDFETETLTGLKLSSKDVRGKVLLIDLWGIACFSCLEEMKALENVYRELSGSGLEIWAVNTDGFDAAKVKAGLRKTGTDVSFPVLLDPEGIVTSIFTSRFIPVTVIVDREGIVRFYKVGFKKSDIKDIRVKLEELLK